MKIAYLLLILVCFGSTIHAQTIESKKLDAGLELDVLPYATGGYFGAAWMGKGLMAC